MAFLETPRFPDDISYGSTGGPGFNTDVIELSSGYEERNQKWSQSRSEYDAAFGIRKEDQLDTLVSYFQVMAGKANTFRFKDWGDYKSCKPSIEPLASDQSLGFGDSTTGSDGTSDFQIVKSYSQGVFTTIREIYKPIDGTVIVEVDGTPKFLNVDYQIDHTTGIISFVLGRHPLLDRGDGEPEEVKCGYEYDVPCRFDTDKLSLSFDAYLIGSTSIPIVEVRI